MIIAGCLGFISTTSSSSSSSLWAFDFLSVLATAAATAPSMAVIFPVPFFQPDPILRRMNPNLFPIAFAVLNVSDLRVQIF
ncbi:hypothetical protein DERP_013939 [Dermatophagoides pteronyssinus]|uniref:Uncharacterized protein n=1 Tax=Dermatophagoides pteronyssinus TaxID=6956 RepID=A0ABQ8JQK1_DERPT|nr:hypothetical protein DERP_013939 [Dermatophagoides pteronyssinus]